jgi:hypothetical protein
MFRDLMNNLKKEAEKRITEQEAQKQQAEPKQQEKPKRTGSRRYGRLAAWIKSKYGDNFKDGQTSDEVNLQLNKIFRDIDSKGGFGSEARKGFKTYIDKRQYGDLVKIRE